MAKAAAIQADLAWKGARAGAKADWLHPQKANEAAKEAELFANKAQERAKEAERLSQ
jgi:hypothetical protein